MTISILLVDDNHSFSIALRRLLETLPGVKIVADAHDGFEALSKAEHLTPDLILLDIALPSLSGLEVARRVQTWTKRPRIVFLSMHDLEEYRDAAHDLIDVEFVEKIDVVSKLIPIIERMVEATA